MSAPAALAISKLSYPETQKSKASSKDFSKMEKAWVPGGRGDGMNTTSSIYSHHVYCQDDSSTILVDQANRKKEGYNP